MKIALVGESYALRSPAAAVQETLNKYPQFIDDPNEHGKNRGILVDCPGFHLATTLGHIFVRGFWSGGGRLFAVGGSHLYELGEGTYVGGNPSTGAFRVISDFDLGSNDGFPVQMFGNGNQLLIIANGFAFIDNGAGPVAARFLISGTINTVGTAVTWVSGDQFTNAMIGNEITIDGLQYLVSAVGSATGLTLSTSAGSQTGASYTSPSGDQITAVTGALLDTYFIVQRPSGFQFSGTVNTAGTAVTYVSGNVFSDVEAGDTIAINGVAYQVQSVNADKVHLTLLTSAGVQAGVSWGFGPDLGRQFNISAPGDGVTWDPLDFASKEGYPDYLQSVFADHEQLILFGTETTEFWQLTGAALFPFQRIPGTMVKIGSVARFGPLSLGNRTYFLGSNSQGPPIAYRIDGFTPVRISTHAAEFAFASGLGNPAAAVSYGYVDDGHCFAVWNFYGNLNTWVYDETASQQAGSPMWHQRAKWTGAGFLPYSPQFHTFIPEWGDGGLHVVGDYNSGKVWEMNLAYPDADGADTSWVRILPYLYAGGLRQFFGRMTLEMETGDSTSLVTQPTITRDYSDDRGQTFINPISVGYGLSGAFSQRVYWPANGSSLNRAFRLQGIGKTHSTLIDLDLDVEVGTS